MGGDTKQRTPYVNGNVVEENCPITLDLYLSNRWQHKAADLTI